MAVRGCLLALMSDPSVVLYSLAACASGEAPGLVRRSGPRPLAVLLFDSGSDSSQVWADGGSLLPGG